MRGGLPYLDRDQQPAGTCGHTLDTGDGSHQRISYKKAFMQGFLCNLLNPKATLFFLAIFTRYWISIPDLVKNSGMLLL